jgi:hypothetical protein
VNDYRETIEEPLPPEPERPDCCNGGCAVCVLDGFEDEVEAWRRQCEAILARRELNSGSD